VAVFIPVLFMSGIVGRLLHEFSVTIVVAILISGFVSLSLTPMLGSRFLKHEHDDAARLSGTARWKAASTCCSAGTSHAAHRHALPPGHAGGGRSDAGGHGVPVLDHAHRLHPQPGQRLHVRRHAGPAGHLVRFHGRHHRAIAEIVRAHPGRRDVGAFVVGGNQAFFFANMKPRDQRALSVDQIIDRTAPQGGRRPGLFTFMQNPPPITVSGQNSASVYQLTCRAPT
jgi:HAE1 family hydrophobic/amphiphilic exporter-1